MFHQNAIREKEFLRISRFFFFSTHTISCFSYMTHVSFVFGPSTVNSKHPPLRVNFSLIGIRGLFFFFYSFSSGKSEKEENKIQLCRAPHGRFKKKCDWIKFTHSSTSLFRSCEKRSESRWTLKEITLDPSHIGHTKSWRYTYTYFPGTLNHLMSSHTVISICTQLLLRN